MATFEFVGETDNVSARQLEYVGSILESRGFKNGKVIIEPVGKKGDNFGSNVKRFIINKDGETFKMVAKIALAGMRNDVNVTDVFISEQLMYATVLPKFAELEKGAGIPINERLRFAACYGSILQAPDEMILLEDLNVENFKMLDRLKPLTSEYVKNVLNSFVMLHSLSYVLKSEEPETFNNYCKKLRGVVEVMGSVKEMPTILAKLENDVIGILDNENEKKRMKNTVSVFLSEALKNLKAFREKHYSVIQQGDAWTNNIMFKIEGEEVVQSCMIDYQISTLNSPVADLIYFIFNCTDYETRSKHYHEWIDYYYTKLERRLNNFGLNILDFYPRDEFNADLRRQGAVGLGHSVMIASVTMRDHHIPTEVNEAKDKDDQPNLAVLGSEGTRRFIDRVKGLIKTCDELGYN